MPKTKMIENEPESVLHVQVPLEVGDYFRYYLDSNRMKMVIALVIYAVFAAALISFFAFIGEQEMLLKTSPMFLALPAAGIVGQLLRAHASTRKYIASLTEAERVLKFSFRNDGDGYDLVQGDNSSHVAWSSIRAVVEKARYFEFRLSKYASYIIPKKSLASASEQEYLRKVLRSKLGNRARLIAED